MTLQFTSFQIANQYWSTLSLECRDTSQLLSAQLLCSTCISLGIKGEFARKWSDTPFIGPEHCIPICTSTLKILISKWNTKRLVYHWQTLHTARQAGNCISINKNNTVLLYRRNLGRLTGGLTGHCTLNRHQQDSILNVNYLYVQLCFCTIRITDKRPRTN